MKQNIDDSDSPSLNGLANHILKTCCDNLKKNEADVQAAVSTSETIHDMRVATRRLRAAIKAFKSILPTKAKKTHAKLQKLGCLLGKKRDLDVFSEFILHVLNAKSISSPKLARQIDKAQKEILSTIKSKWYASLVKSLEQLTTAKSKKNVFKLSKKRVRKALKSVLAIATTIDSMADDKTLHRLRISVKRLRYICEFFAPIFRMHVGSFDSFIERSKTIQDILGEHQNAITGNSMLIHYANQLSFEEFLQINKNYEQKKAKTRKVFFKIWKEYCLEIEFLYNNC